MMTSDQVDDSDSDDVYHPLSRPFDAKGKPPEIRWVDDRIFVLRYFEQCMACSFCDDQCCKLGVGVSPEDVARIVARTREIEPFTAMPPEEWFDEGKTDDADYAGGYCIDTRVVRGGCALRSKTGRGCGLHAFALTTGFDYHDIKPIYCSLFPLSCEEGYLIPSPEVETTLVCAGSGSTLYEGIRHELVHYFGPEFIAELDELQRAAHARTNA